MVSKEFHRSRRLELAKRVSKPILLMGVGRRSRNLPMNQLPFRQDSSFLYLSGCKEPESALLIHDGESTLFLEDHPSSDALWHGPTPSLEERRQSYGFDRVLPSTELENYCKSLPDCATIACSDLRVNLRTQAIVQKSLRFGQDYGDMELVDGLIELRRDLQPEELQIIRKTMETTCRAHVAAMKTTRPGLHERHIAAAFHYEMAKDGLVSAYRSIVTVRGEVLHNESYVNDLNEGDLLLLDGGAEAKSGYATDITRTWPVSNAWTERQLRAYRAVLRAQEASIAERSRCRESASESHRAWPHKIPPTRPPDQ